MLCPLATVNDFAKESSPQKITGQRPAEGVYLWKRAGTQTIDGKTTDLAGFEDRIVQNVKETSAADGGTFEYETVQKNLDATVQTLKWRVRSDAGNSATGHPLNADINSPGVVNFSQNIGEPDRGLSLLSINSKTADGVATNFSPLTPLLYMPYNNGGVIPGRLWSALSLDPLTLTAVQLDGSVLGHSEVDVCGTIIDGWKVSSTLTYTSRAGRLQVKYVYVVANQLGGMIISEHIESPAEAPTLRVDFTLGQVKPKPIPGT